MRLKIQAVFVPKLLGGRATPPAPGLRCGIRWQKFVAEWIKQYRDIHVLTVQGGIDGGILTVTGELICEHVPENWLEPGSEIELLDGYRVIGVGKIVEAYGDGTSQ